MSLDFEAVFIKTFTFRSHISAGPDQFSTQPVCRVSSLKNGPPTSLRHQCVFPARDRGLQLRFHSVLPKSSPSHTHSRQSSSEGIQKNHTQGCPMHPTISGHDTTRLPYAEHGLKHHQALLIILFVNLAILVQTSSHVQFMEERKKRV